MKSLVLLHALRPHPFFPFLLPARSPKVECLVYTPLTSEQLALLKGIKHGDVARAARGMGWRMVRARQQAGVRAGAAVLG